MEAKISTRTRVADAPQGIYAVTRQYHMVNMTSRYPSTVAQRNWIDKSVPSVVDQSVEIIVVQVALQLLYPGHYLA